jgi:hypothetical protein
VPFLFNRDSLDVIDLLSATWSNVFRQYWVELSVAAFLFSIVPAIASYAVQLPSFILSFARVFSDTTVEILLMGITLLLTVLGVIVQFVLQVSFQRGIIEMTCAAWNGQKLAFGALFKFKAGLRAGAAWLLVHIPALVLAGLAAALIGGAIAIQSGLFLAFAIALVVAATIVLLIWLLPTQLLFQLFAENPDVGIVEAIRLCFERGRGYRWKIFLAGLISIHIALAGLLACGIGLLPALGLIFAYQTGLWKALSTPGANSGIPA